MIDDTLGLIYIIFVVPNQIIYNNLCIIKNYIKSKKISLSFKQTFSNKKFSTVQSKTLRKLSKKLIKLNKTTIQKIKIKIIYCNSFSLKQ